jgi:guanylate kinase
MNNLQRRGLMFVLSSPSGAGKTTIAQELIKSEPELTISVSVTTRPKRPGEQDSIAYHFVDKDEFIALRDSEKLIEHAEVFGHYYGTLKKTVFDNLGVGKDVLFDIDWQGTQQLSHIARTDLVSIFIMPPSMQELEKRLESRDQDSDDVIKKRMEEAFNEISHWAEYDYVVINNNVQQSVLQTRAILIAERLKRSRQLGVVDLVNSFKK